MNSEGQEVHALIDCLAPSQLAAVHTLLTTLLDPVSRTIANAPLDDEPETEHERRAVAEAEEWHEHNALIPFDEVSLTSD